MEARAQGCFFHCFCCFSLFFSIFFKLKLCKNGKDILWLKLLLTSHSSFHFFNASSVNMVGFVNPHKVFA